VDFFIFSILDKLVVHLLLVFLENLNSFDCLIIFVVTFHYGFLYKVIKIVSINFLITHSLNLLVIS